MDKSDSEESSCEQPLSSNRYGFYEILNRSPAILFIWRVAPGEWPVEFVSENVERYIGYTATDFTSGRVSWPGITHPDDVARLEEEVKGYLESGCREWSQEYRLTTQSGEVRWFRDQNIVLTDAEGQFTHIQSIIMDVTEQRQAEQALKESEETFRNLAEQSPNMIFINQGGRLVYANHQCEAMMGYPREIIFTPDFDFMQVLTPESRDRVRENYQRHMQGQEVPPVEYTLIKQDGERLEAIVSTKLIQYGGSPAVLGTVTDITRRKQTEEALHQLNIELEARVQERTAELSAINERLSEEIRQRRKIDEKLRVSEGRYRLLVENASEEIYAFDAKGILTFLNTKASQTLGDEPEAFVGKSITELFPASWAEQQVEQIQMVIRTGKGQTLVVETVIQDQVKWYETSWVPLPLPGQTTRGVLVVARDITALKQAELQLNEYRDQIAKTERLVAAGTLSMMVAHELTQPLTVIQLSVQNALAALKTHADREVEDDLIDSLNQVTNATTIVNRFRTFARSSQDRPVEALQLEPLVTKILRITEEKAHRARLLITAQGLSRLPVIQACQADLEQLCHILVDNSIQAANGEADHHLQISGSVKEGLVKLVFRDDCGGIDPQLVDHIFEPFFTTKDPGQGTGLGLSIVERVIEELGGRITVKNQAGHGVVFSVYLPIEN